MQPTPELLLAIASGIVLSAACGVRAFLPPFSVGIAARLGWIPLEPSVQWLEATPTLVCLGVATLVEIAGDKIPLVDHALDAIGTVVRPAAAYLAGFALLAHWPTPWAQLAALLLSGGALFVHGLKAKTRIGSTALTMGHANPLLSTAEDATALGLVVTAILVPLLALALVIVLIVALARRRRTARVATPESAAPEH